MGLLSKLHLKKDKKDPAEADDGKGHRHHTKPKKTQHKYESEDVVEGERDTSKVGSAQLVIGDAPTAPGGGGGGFQSNTNYAINTGGAPGPVNPKGGGSVPLKGGAKDKATDSDHPSDAIASGLDQQSGKKGTLTGASGLAPPGDAQHAPTVPQIPDRPGLVIQMGEVFKVAGLLLALWMVLFLKWLRPGILGLFGSTGLGVGVGFGLVFLFFYNVRRKKALNDGLNMTPGTKGLKKLLGTVPSWITFQEKEKVEWLNKLVGEAWPFYDRAICDIIKETVTPIMEQYKPPLIIKSMYFMNLTFGDAPIQVDSVWIEQEAENHILMEIGFRWSGDANIALCVELPGEVAKLIPRVTDLRVGGTLRVILAPLCDTIPCFGAAVISLRTPPLIHFNLDFAGLAATAVKAWLDPFLRETLVSLLVWPNRIVVPLLSEDQTGSLEMLFLRHEGLLVVEVVEARGLQKAELVGKADPLVTLWTQHVHKQQTHHKSKTLDPKWNEFKYCLVQEPKTQNLHVEVHDYDVVNFAGLASSINVVKNAIDSFGAHEFMARTNVPIRQFADSPGQPVDAWEPLGPNEWWDEEGTGKGHGEIHLRGWYWPFDMLYSQGGNARMGAVLVHLKCCEDMSAADDNGLSDPYCTLTLGKKSVTSAIKYRTCDPQFDEKHDWSEVSVREVLVLKFYDSDKFTGDDYLGMVEVQVDEMAKAQQGLMVRKWFLAEVPETMLKDGGKGPPPKSSVTMEIRWVPYIHPHDLN